MCRDRRGMFFGKINKMKSRECGRFSACRVVDGYDIMRRCAQERVQSIGTKR
jgi:hypothetical protein